MVKHYISAAPKLFKTARLLRTALKEEGIFSKASTWDRPRKRVRYLIRYGSMREFGRVRHELNSRGAIASASNKYNARRAIDDFEVRVPNYSLNPHELDPPIIRRPFRHFKCYNFKLYHDSSEVTRDYGTVTDHPGYYFQEYIKPKKEYRIHMFKGKPVRVQVKYRRTEYANEYKRGMKFGWGFKIRRERPTSEKLLSMASDAMEAVGLDFGAIDALLGRDRRFYILEINTAPGLNRNGARLYAENIADWIETY